MEGRHYYKFILEVNHRIHNIKQTKKEVDMIIQIIIKLY
jgi:hypothetical protein